MEPDIKKYIKLLYDGSSNFEDIAKTFTVLDIAEPIDEINGGLTFIEAWDSLFYGGYAVIKTDEKTFGYVDLKDGDMDILDPDFTEQYNANTGRDIDTVFYNENQELEKLYVSDFAKPLSIEQLVASTTPILKIFHLFLTKDVIFILEDDEITHAINFLDLDKTPVKLCLFALLLELESNMSKLLRKQPNLDQFINMLPSNSIQKLNDHAKRHFKYKKEISNYELLKFTNLKEKHNMIREHLIVDDSGDNLFSGLDGNFNVIQRLRNEIAHGESILSIIDDPKALFNEIMVILLYMKVINHLSKNKA